MDSNRFTKDLTRAAESHVNAEIAAGRLDATDEAAVNRELQNFLDSPRGQQGIKRVGDLMVNDAFRQAGFKRRGDKWVI